MCIRDRQLGALLEELTVARARAGIEKLVHLTPQTARLLEDGAERTVPAQEVRVGDLLRVLPGESVPVEDVYKRQGLGDVDWGAYCSALTDIGYDGAACIEVEDKAFEDCEASVLKSIRLSMRYMEQFVI